MSNQAEKLLRCPFCGSDATIRYGVGLPDGGTEEVDQSRAVLFCAACSNDNCVANETNWIDDKASAIARWNLRSTPSRELVEAVKNYVGDDLIVYRHGVESCKSHYHVRSEAYSELVDALRSALSGVAKECEWVDDSGDGSRNDFVTSCGKQIVFDEQMDGDSKFCCFCGLSIKLKENG